MNARRVWGLALAAGLLGLTGSSALAVTYTWNTFASGNWSTASSWDVNSAYPANPGDVAIISDQLPTTTSWGNNASVVVTTFTIDGGATINGANLQLTDFDTYAALAPHNVEFDVVVNNSATFNRIDWFNDPNGAGRSRLSIASGKTLSVNVINMTGRFPNNFGNGGTLAFTADGGGAATYGYAGSTEQMGGNGTYDHSAVTTMNYTCNYGLTGAPPNGSGTNYGYLEGRDITWKVGNAAADQSWNITGTGQQNPLRLVLRTVGNPWNFIKVGNNNVDMGFRTTGTPSKGVQIERSTSGDNGGMRIRFLFTDASGNAVADVGKTVTIANYEWQENQYDGTNGNATGWCEERVGENLVINNGQLYLLGRIGTNPQDEDVNAFRVLSGKTVTISGATGNILIDKSATTNTGRMGLLFEGATLTAGGNLSVLGDKTFLNGGTTGGTINVGGNVQVQSRNASGFGTITGLPTTPTVLTASADDFNLLTSTIAMNGGGARVLNWDTGSALGGPLLQASDFLSTNFTLGALSVTNGTSVTYTQYRNLFLANSLSLDATSFMDMYLLPWTGSSHIYLQGIGQLAQVQGWIASGQLRYAGVTQVGTVGLDIFGIPEPASLFLLAAGGALALRRRRT